MNSFSEKTRRVIPRWRNFRVSAKLGEILPLRLPPPSEPMVLSAAEAWHVWDSTKNPNSAGELLSSGLLSGDEKAVREASAFLLNPRSQSSSFAQEFARSLLANESLSNISIPESHAGNDPRSVRALLRLNPFDAVAWADLARFHTIGGRFEKAHRAILTALRLAPDNRYILRTAVRCLIHLEKADQALFHLIRCETTEHDPWLLSAHLTASSIEGKISRLRKRALAVSTSDMDPLHLSELRASLASDELMAGNSKKGRKLLQAALQKPTENVIAQAWWASRVLNMEPPVHMVGRDLAFEADTKAALASAQWENAERAASAWLADEPFSSRPAITCSFLHAVAFEEHEVAIQILRSALKANPGDPQLLNNLAFSLANIGKTEEASDLVRAALQAADKDNLKIAPLATSGLIDFRMGNAEAGRAKYREAMRMADDSKLYSTKSLASLFLAREERLAKTPEAESTLKEAIELTDKHPPANSELIKQVMIDGPKKRSAADSNASADA